MDIHPSGLSVYAEADTKQSVISEPGCSSPEYAGFILLSLCRPDYAKIVFLIPTKPPQLLRNQRHLLLIALLGLSLPAWAANDWSLCAAPTLQRQPVTESDIAVTEILADELISEQRDFLSFQGQVELTRGQQSIRSDRLELFRNPDRMEASGHLLFSDDLYRLSANQLMIDDSNDLAIFDQADFQLFDNHLRGYAERIEQIDNDLSQLFDVSYTTCDPGQNAWLLSAGSLRLNQQDGRGTARHVVLRLGGLPVFYFPWFQFPIDDRRMSGLLTPTLSHSSIDGYQLSVPVYWNLAANYDMTIMPQWFSERGLQLNTENRYLLRNQTGQLDLSWLDDDLYQDERWFARWAHEAESDFGINTRILLQEVSDTEFPDDFELLGTIQDIDFLPSSIRFSANIYDWSSGLLFEQYQTINLLKPIASRPYKRLPQLTLNRRFNTSGPGLTIDWRNEWVRFEREDSINGDRLHISPQLSYTLEDSYYYIQPSLQIDLTRYQIDPDTSNLDNIERELALFSVDSGLFFERVAGAETQWIQTLEPRLYLLYVPYEEQSEIPDFDTALLAESYDNLFVNNRFSGADRIGDSRQLSVGLTSRLLSATGGEEILRASIGQAFYAEDRKVSLNGSTDDREKSSLMSLLRYKPRQDWDIQLASVYDQEEKESRQTDVSFRHHRDLQAFNVEYHFRKDNLEQTTLSFVYPVTTRWTGFGKHQYSIEHEKPVQNLFGLAYESCCWGFKVLYEEAANDSFEEVDRGVYFELTLKGLSSAGKDIDSILEDGILGYQPVF